MKEAEKITIIEGPSPEFKPAAQLWNIGIYQGYDEHDVGWLELRTGNGEAIRDRCKNAWREGRTVELDYPDHMRMRQTASVIAMRLVEVDEGTILNLWVYQPVDENASQSVFDDDDDDGLSY